jgi:Protein of unknown function (DUF4031)
MLYVDELREFIKTSKQAKKHGKFWCHLFSDSSIDELHEFANLIGLKKEWFQSKKNFPHYDLVSSKRKLAVQFGAKEIKLKEFLKERFANV